MLHFDSKVVVDADLLTFQIPGDALALDKNNYHPFGFVKTRENVIDRHKPPNKARLLGMHS
jgi:hypothetical protein